MTLNSIGYRHPYIRAALAGQRDRLYRGWRRRSVRRTIRRRLGDDPTVAIRSRCDAFEIAEWLLKSVPYRNADDEIWASVGVMPLAELLYAASAQRRAGGIAWAGRALDNVDADVDTPGWRQAADVFRRGAHPTDSADLRRSSGLLRAADLPARQRSGVVAMMRAAIAPWMPAPAI